MSPNSDPCEVVITAPDAKWLNRFAGKLVEDRLAAAAHLESIRTIYWWQHDMHEAEEWRATLHTRSDLVSDIVNRTNREHPYEVPCVVAKSLFDGNARYLDWITRETTD